MDIGQIFKRLGGAALKNIPPLGIATEILSFVNDILPKDKQLSESSTGIQAVAAIAELPEDKQAEVLLKQFDVELAEISAHVDITKVLAEVDKVGSSTRPDIAKAFAWNLIIISDLLVCGILFAVYKNQITLENCWPLILALLTPFATVVGRYFGLRHKEKAQKYEAVSNTSPAIGLVSQIVGKFIKR